MDDYDNDQRALEAMERFGGIFASNLARAWQRADIINERKLRAAFPELLAEYRQMVTKKKVTP